MKWVDLDPADRTIINELRETATEEYKLQRLNPDPFRKTTPRENHHLNGAIQLGTIPHFDFPYGIEIDILKKHLFVAGLSGGGKTTFIRNLLLQILQYPSPPKIMILERKQEFTELLSLYPDFHVLNVASLTFNPLRPPKGISTPQWIGIFTECMINYLDILEASSSFIMDHALRLIKQDETLNHFPNLGKLRNFIAQTNYKPFSKNGQQKETVLNRLNILLNSFPSMFSSNKSSSIEKLMNSNCLILLHDITHTGIQNFIISLLMAQSFLYKKTHFGLQETLTNLIVLDEASSLFRRQDETREKPSYISDVVKTARGYGVGLIAASQSTTDLSHALLANANTRMMIGGFGRTQDTDVFLRLRGYTQEQRQYVITHPIVGKAFIADSRWPHVIECNLNNPNLPPRLTAQTLEARIQESAKQLTSDIQKLPPAEVSMPVTQAVPPTPMPETVAIEVRILESIYNNHFMRTADRHRQLNIPSSTLVKEIKTLEANGYIKIYKVHGKSGAPRDLYEVKEAGFYLLEKPVKKMKGKGSYLHQFYQQQVARHFKAQGYSIRIEGVAHGKNIDLIALKQPGGECVAIEIELGSTANPDHVIENIERAAAADFIERILILVPTTKEATLVKKLVTKNQLSEERPIQIERLWKYMER